MSTSINQYEESADIEELYEEEYKLYDQGVERLKKHIYFPGYFYEFGEKYK